MLAPARLGENDLQLMPENSNAGLCSRLAITRAKLPTQKGIGQE